MEKRCFFSVPAEEVFDPKRIKQWAGLETLIVEQSSRQLWNKTTHSYISQEISLRASRDVL